MRLFLGQGMRATEGHDTVLDGAFVSDSDVLAVVPAGPSDDPAVGAMAIGAAFTHETTGKALLGINPTGTRWWHSRCAFLFLDPACQSVT